MTFSLPHNTQDNYNHQQEQQFQIKPHPAFKTHKLQLISRRLFSQGPSASHYRHPNHTYNRDSWLKYALNAESNVSQLPRHRAHRRRKKIFTVFTAPDNPPHVLAAEPRQWRTWGSAPQTPATTAGGSTSATSRARWSAAVPQLDMRMRSTMTELLCGGGLVLPGVSGGVRAWQLASRGWV